MRSWLARLVSAEVRRLTEQRRTAVRVAMRWRKEALMQEARADALADQHTKEQD